MVVRRVGWTQAESLLHPIPHLHKTVQQVLPAMAMAASTVKDKAGTSFAPEAISQRTQCHYCKRLLVGRRWSVHPLWPEIVLCGSCVKRLPRCLACERKAVAFTDPATKQVYPALMLGKDVRVCGICRSLRCVFSDEDVRPVVREVLLFFHKFLDLSFASLLLKYRRQSKENSKFMQCAEVMSREYLDKRPPIHHFPLDRKSPFARCVPMSPLATSRERSRYARPVTFVQRQTTWHDRTLQKIEKFPPVQAPVVVATTAIRGCHHLISHSANDCSGCRVQRRIAASASSDGNSNGRKKNILRHQIVERLPCSLSPSTSDSFSVVSSTKLSWMTFQQLIRNVGVELGKHVRPVASKDLDEVACLLPVAAMDLHKLNESAGDTVSTSAFLKYGRCDMRRRVRRGVEHRHLDQILVVRGLPRDVFAAHLAHELLHAFLFLSGVSRLSEDVEEGLCNAVSVLFLCYRLVSMPTDVYGRQQCEELCSFAIRKFYQCNHQAYGLECRKSLALYSEIGFANTLSKLQPPDPPTNNGATTRLVATTRRRV